MVLYEFLETGLSDIADMSIEDIPDVKTTVDWLERITPTLLRYLKVFGISLLVLIIGRKLIKMLIKFMAKSFERIKLEEGLSKFLESLAKAALYFVLIAIIAGILGLETSSLVAVLGSVGLAIGLALQGSLSNIAGGVLILVSKPFLVGDVICTSDGEGTVIEIGMIYTRLRTIDNRIIIIPNGSLANSGVVNITTEKERMLDFEVDLSYQADLKLAKQVLEALAGRQDKVLKDKEIKVFVKELSSSSVVMGVRMWVLTENYWDLKWSFTEEAKEELEKHGIEIPYNQLDVHMIHEKN